VVDFLLVLIGHFWPAPTLRHYERILFEIVVIKGVGLFERKFPGEEGSRPPTTIGVEKLEFLGYHVALKAGFIAGQLNSTRRRVELRRESVHSDADATRRRVVEADTVHQRSTIISERLDPFESICRARRKL